MLSLLALPAGCAAPAASVTALACPAGTQPMLMAELFFGRGGIGQPAWDGFAADTLTSAFPDGFTVLEDSGQWRDPDPAGGGIGREPGTMVLIAAPDDAASHAGLDRIRKVYEARFSQKSVGLLLDRRCGDFSS